MAGQVEPHYLQTAVPVEVVVPVFMWYLWYLRYLLHLKCLTRYMRNKKVAAVVSSSKMISKVTVMIMISKVVCLNPSFRISQSQLGFRVLHRYRFLSLSP